MEPFPSWDDPSVRDQNETRATISWLRSSIPPSFRLSFLQVILPIAGLPCLHSRSSQPRSCVRRPGLRIVTSLRKMESRLCTPASGTNSRPPFSNSRLVRRPAHDKLAELLSIAITGCGGWILEQSETQDGLLRVLFEFECERAMEIYGVLVSLGIQLSRYAHLSLIGLWQCARHGHCFKRLPVTRIRMTIQTGWLPATSELSIMPS